jgi:MOSC domain-containing protein YiiM
MEILHLYISEGHNYVGHHGRPPGEHEIIEVDEIHCVAGHGLENDRYFDHQDDFKGQITFFADEVYQDLRTHFSGHEVAPSAFRRNVITRGLDLNDLIGKEFEVQGVRFYGTEECRPCYWMNQAFASGAEAAMRGRGGLRAKIITGGILRVDRGDRTEQVRSNPSDAGSPSPLDA